MEKLKNIKITIEYDGTDFEGWQTQPSGRSVQDVLQKALSQVLGGSVKVVGAGRTDAGVHARAQVANFFTAAEMDTNRIRWSVNAVLPDTIVINRAEEAPPDFDARRQARLRTYIYYIWNERYASPFFRRYSWWTARPLDINSMNQAAGYLIGEHDFAAFTPEKEKSTSRDLSALKVEELPEYPGRMIGLTAAADSFLYHLVRMITGTLIEVGLGNMPPEKVREILTSKDIRLAGPKAPAKGLFLKRIDY